PIQRTEHSRMSKAVAKKHVITEEVLSQAEGFFEAENAFLADACKQTAAVHTNDEEVDEEKETSETVSEEIDCKFSLVLIAAQQDRLVNGKNFNEIVSFAKDVTIRRRQKYAYAKFSADVQKFVSEFEDIKSDPNLSIDTGAEKIYGVKKVNYEIHPDSVQKKIGDFFRDFTKYRVQHDLLKLLNDFYKRVDKKYVMMFQSFNKQVDWTDKKSFEPYFNMLQATFICI
ncbi:unnamed protein product, partial [Didymodactylos carnosus]